MQGVADGNCGNDANANAYLPCASNDIRCGLIMCTGDFSNHFYFGTSVSNQIRRTGRGDVCNTVTIRADERRANPGLVREGSPCATGMVNYIIVQSLLNIFLILFL